MKTITKIAIGCLSLPFILVLLIWVIVWVGHFDHGFSRYRDNCKKISTYLKNPTERIRYEGELRSILQLHKYPDVIDVGDVIYAYMIPFPGTFKAMGHKLAVLMHGTPEDIEERIYQAAKEAMDSGNYVFASRFFMVLGEFEYKDSQELMVQARSKNRRGLSKGDYLNLGMRKWDSEGHLAPMPWKVVGQMEGKLLLEAEYAVEYRALDENFCEWLNGEMFNEIFFDGSGSAVVPLGEAQLERLASVKPDPAVSEFYCQDFGNRFFLVSPDKHIYSGEFIHDNLYPPYLRYRLAKVNRLAKAKSSSDDDFPINTCCRSNEMAYQPKEWIDSVIAVVPSIFVDTLLLKRY